MARARPALTARAAGLVGCRHCGRVSLRGTRHCACCGSRLHSRAPGSVQRVWAWWIAGLVAYVPANIYPFMITDTLAGHYASTIIGGAVELVAHGDALVGLVVLAASVAIPVAKFLAIAVVMWLISRPYAPDAHRVHRLHAVVEFIGRWSMIDVFVVAILSALVHLGAVAQIDPGVAAACFAASVIFTMMSANSLDPRLIWDALEKEERARVRPRPA